MSMIEFYLTEPEDLSYPELVGMRDAVLRKMKQIGQDQNDGNHEDVPSPECCDFLAQYLAATNEEIARKDDVREEFGDLIDQLIDLHMDEYNGMDKCLSELLEDGNGPSFDEFGVSGPDFFDAFAIVARNRGIKLHAVHDWSTLVYNPKTSPYRLIYSSIFAKEPPDALDYYVEDMIEKIEDELA